MLSIILLSTHFHESTHTLHCTMSQVHHISKTLKVGDLTLKNRNVMASLTRNRNVPTNVPNDIVLEYYVQRAKGGCALILTEGTLVCQQGTEWPNAPGIWNEEQVKGWKKITDAVHEAGSYIFCQVGGVISIFYSQIHMPSVSSGMLDV